mmetsp:Transcript_7133/g.21560  ORF Transcript_7133/g.21560 Transcript_7133/m.21560 type:complete len:252 (+) Transcript_7133:1719-2474(+)
MTASCASYPEFSANVFGMTSIASANASTPLFALPSTDFFVTSFKCTKRPASKAPAPGITALSINVFFTARKPSLTASFNWMIVCWFGPFNKIVHDVGFATSSINVNFSSPKMCSYTCPAWPKTSGDNSSGELTHTPPHAKTNRSIFLLFARRNAKIFSFANISNEIGSIPFCVITTNPLSFPSHTFFFNAITCLTTSSVNFLSASTIFSLCSAFEYIKLEFTSDFSYSMLMLHVKINASSTCFGISGCLDP